MILLGLQFVCLTQAMVNLQAFGDSIFSRKTKLTLSFHGSTWLRKVAFPENLSNSLHAQGLQTRDQRWSWKVHSQAAGGKGNSSLNGGDWKGKCPQKCC